MPWRAPDLRVLSERFGPADRGPRPPPARARWPRLRDVATWVGFGGERVRARGLARERIAPLGAPVSIDVAGVVRARVSLHPGGVALAIAHDTGLGTVILQLADVRLEVGDRVEAADVVGRVAGVSRDPRRRADAPHVILQRVWLGEPVHWEATPTEAAFDGGAVENGIAACRDVGLRGHLDGLPTLEERAWALTLWRTIAPESFTRLGRLDEAPERDLPT